MDTYLFIILFIAILIGVSIILYKLKVSLIFIWINAVLGTIFISIAIMEASFRFIYPPQIDYMGALWGMITVVTIAMPVLLYLAFRFEKRDRWSGKEALFLGILVIGCYLFWGAIEDFSCFIIWGLEYLNPTDAYWILYWINGVVPTHYVLFGVSGIILIVIALWWSRRIIESTTQPIFTEELARQITQELQDIEAQMEEI